jgi:hypothetical protein
MFITLTVYTQGPERLSSGSGILTLNLEWEIWSKKKKIKDLTTEPTAQGAAQHSGFSSSRIFAIGLVVAVLRRF